MELCKRIAIVELPEKGAGLVVLEPITADEVIARWCLHNSRMTESVVDSLDA